MCSAVPIIRATIKISNSYLYIHTSRTENSLNLLCAMAILEYPEIFLLILCFTFLCFLKKMAKTKTSAPTNWPLFGMLPGLLQNCYRIHDYITEILTECGGTFEFKGPLFCNMDILITCDPSNIHHVFSKNFSNYPKGPEFKKMFDILGDGIFNADNELWELHRRTTLAFMGNSKFYSLLKNTIWLKVEKALVPVLDYFSENGNDFDLQEIFQRLTFDGICKLVLDHDPGSLSIDLPTVPCEKGFNLAIEALFRRHVLPERIWKLQRTLKIGAEKKMIQAWEAFDEFIYPIVGSGQKDDHKLLATFKKAHEEMNGPDSPNLKGFLRDTSLNLMLAGRDTTSTCLTWLFWLIAMNPFAKVKIREEIEAKLQFKENKCRFFSVEESRKLVYLHGALSESLRLFPPVALEHKSPIQPDLFPSGNYIGENTKVIISFYSTGRMESVWGKDCLEFKPERWITERGGIKHEPSYKFPAFNAGPRTCLGKEMAFIQMRMVAAFIIYHYDVKLVKGHPILPSDSIIVQAKQGLRVRISRRNA